MILDAAVWLGHWPFADLEPDTADELVAHQAAAGINLSFVAPLEACFLTDPQPANVRLLRQLREHPTLEPVPVVNPTLGNWADTLEHLTGRHRCRQIRLLPGYHQYELTAPCVTALLAACAVRQVRVGVQLRLEDERAQHPLAQVPAVPAAALTALAAAHPGQRLLALGAYRHEALQLAPAGLLVELSHVECLDTLNDLLQQVDSAAMVFGSHTPLFVTRAGLVKLEACTADPATVARVAGGNLSQWLGGQRDAVPWRTLP
ncbi:MAG: hypothetical protein IT204_01365 [Fimbriimonadaceae bacterium]|nr:hypothetical protein [Fimbriimonadaceae bacterium]